MQASMSAQEAALVKPSQVLLPQTLLPLVHAYEVQDELGLTDREVNDLEQVLRRLDGDWFRSRNLPPEGQWQEQDRLGVDFRKWSRAHWKPDRNRRLDQLELQAQGPRMLLRSDVAEELNLSAEQTATFAERAQATASAQANLQEAVRRGEATESLEGLYSDAHRNERNGVASTLTDEQKKRLADRLGPTFDTSGLKRIYPLAPEFAAGTEWINSKPLTFESLKGRVVVVHFYAFQCQNCQANFEVYRRWHQRYHDRNVVLIGIQSPETALERDLEAVRQAAVDRQLEFPIVMDAEMKNWKNWANTMWPTVYVIDKRGYLRRWWQGELNWQGATGDREIEAAIETALAE
jgi:peroxiredoxin